MIRFLCKSCNVRDKSSSFDFGLKTAIESAPTCLESAISLPFRNRCRLYRYYIRNVTLRGVMLGTLLHCSHVWFFVLRRTITMQLHYQVLICINAIRSTSEAKTN